MIIQKTLMDKDFVQQRTVYLKNIKATFCCTENSFYDIVLEINSNKFFLSVQQIANQIQEFQIVCVKWFIELSNKLIFLLRQLVSHLFIRLNYV